MERAALANSGCRALDGCSDEAAADGLRGSFQAGYQRRATRQQSGESADKLGDLRFQPDIAEDGNFWFQAIDGQGALVGACPNENCGCQAGANGQDDEKIIAKRKGEASMNWVMAGSWMPRS